MKDGDFVRNKSCPGWGSGVVRRAGKSTQSVEVLFENYGETAIQVAFLELVDPASLAATSLLRDRNRWCELAIPRSPAQKRKMKEDDLVVAIRLGTTLSGGPIIWAEDFVRDWLKRNHLETGERRGNPTASFNGPFWMKADEDACSALRLFKWKRNNRLGWSLSDKRREALEEASQGGYVRVERRDGRWTYQEWDTTSSQWKAVPAPAKKKTP